MLSKRYYPNQVFTGFFGPHGPSSPDTHGLFTSIVLPVEHDWKTTNAKRINKTFFIFVPLLINK
jgi:hypothetical protein